MSDKRKRPLSDKHKASISAGLIKHYENDPTAKIRHTSAMVEKNANRPRMSKEEIRLQYIKKTYDIDWNEWFILQNGCCAICGKHQSELKKALYVDHNHKTGEVRGLLCSKCNFGLGLFEENVELLKKAIEYVNKQNKYLGE